MLIKRNKGLGPSRIRRLPFASLFSTLGHRTECGCIGGGGGDVFYCTITTTMTLGPTYVCRLSDYGSFFPYKYETSTKCQDEVPC